MVTRSVTFDVYQGQVNAQHRVRLSNLRVNVDRPQGTVEWPGGSGNVTLRTARVFVNEGSREVIVRRTTRGGGGATSSPGTGGAVSSGVNSHFRIVRDPNNQTANTLGPPFRATLPRGSQHGTELRFTLSQAGLDTFYVVASSSAFQSRSIPAGAEIVAIQVFKRVKYHYRKMHRSGSTGPVFEMDNALRGVAQYYEDTCGVVLEQLDVGTVPHTGTLQSGAMRQTAGVASGRQPNEIWVLACDRLNSSQFGTVVGLGGTGIATVAIGEMEANRTSNAATRTALQRQMSSQGQSIRNTRMMTWPTVCSNNNMGPGTALHGTCMALQSHSAQQLFDNQLPEVLIHELGHVFTLVPTNQQAAGSVQTGWHDSQNSGHCSDHDCAMFWTVRQGGVSWLISQNRQPALDSNCEFAVRTAPLNQL